MRQNLKVQQWGLSSRQNIRKLSKRSLEQLIEWEHRYLVRISLFYIESRKTRRGLKWLYKIKRRRLFTDTYFIQRNFLGAKAWVIFTLQTVQSKNEIKAKVKKLSYQNRWSLKPKCVSLEWINFIFGTGINSGT